MKTPERDGGWFRQETYRLPGGCLEGPDDPSFAGAEPLTTLISTGAPGERRRLVRLSHPTRTAQIEAVAALVGRAGARDRDSLVRVWADPGTGVPARIDVEWRMAERTIRTTIFRLAWNVELPDSLFEAAIPDGWTVVRADR